MKNGKVVVFRILSTMLILAGGFLVYLNLLSEKEEASVTGGLGIIISGLALFIMSFTIFKEKK